MRITRQQFYLFKQFLTQRNISWREHSSHQLIDGIQVQSGTHWMSVVWNKNFRTYTVDKRLEKLLTEFKGTQSEDRQ